MYRRKLQVTGPANTPCFFPTTVVPLSQMRATKSEQNVCYIRYHSSSTVTVMFRPLPPALRTGGHPSFRTPSKGRLLAARTGAAVAARLFLSQGPGRALGQGRIQASVRESVDEIHQDRCGRIVLEGQASCRGGWWRSWGRGSAKENEGLMFFFFASYFFASHFFAFVLLFLSLFFFVKSSPATCV